MFHTGRPGVADWEGRTSRLDRDRSKTGPASTSVPIRTILSIPITVGHRVKDRITMSGGLYFDRANMQRRDPVNSI